MKIAAFYLTSSFEFTLGLPLQVDGLNIQGYTNQQAVEVLRHTGQSVQLKLIRRGFRPDEIPPATAVTPSVTVLPPYGTVPSTAAVLSDLELERKRSEEELQGWITSDEYGRNDSSCFCTPCAQIKK